MRKGLAHTVLVLRAGHPEHFPGLVSQMINAVTGATPHTRNIRIVTTTEADGVELSHAFANGLDISTDRIEHMPLFTPREGCAADHAELLHFMENLDEPTIIVTHSKVTEQVIRMVFGDNHGVDTLLRGEGYYMHPSAAVMEFRRSTTQRIAV